MSEFNYKPLNILMGYAVVLPIAVAVIYFLGPLLVQGQGDEILLVFIPVVTVVCGVGGFVIGSTCTGRWLIVAGILSICLLLTMVGLVVYQVSQPTVIPPYP